MKDRHAVGTHTERQEHESQLRHGGVGQHLLDVGLHQRHRGGEERREHADHRDHLRGFGRHHVDARHARREIHTRRDHRGGVDQRRHRRGASHGVGEPHIQRNLRRFPGGAHEQQHPHQAGRHEHRRACAAQERAVDRVHIERAEGTVQQEHAQQEAGVADTVGDERLATGLGIGEVVEPEADQQIRGESHALPTHEQHQHRAAQHQQQHEEQKKIQVREEAPEALVAVHVAGGINVDHRSDTRDHQRHDRAEAIEVEGDLERRRTDQRPAIERLDDRGEATCLQVDERLDGEREGRDREGAADERSHALVGAMKPERGGEESVQQKADERQQGDERQRMHAAQPLRSA